MAAAHNYLKRTEVSDANLQTGRYARLGTATPTNVLAQVNVDPYQSGTSGGIYRGGVFIRYVDTSNWLMMVITGWTGVVGSNPGWALIKRVAGVETTLATGKITSGGTGFSVPISLQALSDGSIQASVEGMEGNPVGKTDAALATGGALEKGGFGIYDAWTSAAAMTRVYDSFLAFTPPTDAAVFSKQSVEVRSDRVQREDAGGTLWVPRKDYKGSYFKPPPARREARPVRTIVKLSRGNIDTMADPSIDDASFKIFWQSRGLVLPES
jgi:hypothetical protein